VAKVGIGAARDLTRTRLELLAENALLRQQVIVLRRGIRRPRIYRDDRWLLLILARLCRRWRDALQVVKPDLLRGPRHTGSRPFQRDPLSHRRFGRPTVAGSHTALLRAEVSHSGQRRQVRKDVCRIYFNRARPHQGLRQ